MLCAESDSGHLINYKRYFSQLEDNMTNNLWDFVTLSECKFYLEMLYREDPMTLSNQLNLFTYEERFSTIHRFVVYSLYHLPLTFVNFEVFKPFFKPFKLENSYEVALSLNWVHWATRSPQLSEEAQKKHFNSWIKNDEYKSFSEELLKNLHKGSSFTAPFRFSHEIIENVYFKYKMYSEYVLKMALYDANPLMLPIVVFLHVNPTLTLEECVCSPILKGFFRFNEVRDASSITEFLTQITFKLERYDPILISPIYTDVVRGFLVNLLRSIK
jgi:hypothetical protein